MKLEAYVAGGVGQNTRLLKKLSELLGGVTVVQGHGLWADEEGGLGSEQTSIIIMFGEGNDLGEARYHILSAAKDAREKAVGFYDGHDFIIEETGVL